MHTLECGTSCCRSKHVAEQVRMGVHCLQSVAALALSAALHLLEKHDNTGQMTCATW